MPVSQLKPKHGSGDLPPDDICLFAQTTFRNQMRRFGIKVDDRRRHMYIIGKTGMGKTTMMENMVLHDIYAGHGVGVVDPHGDFAEKIINYIPPKRINDVVYFNPADIDYPIGFNILEVGSEDQKHLVAAGLMGIFKKIWPDVWSSRMEYILNNTILALLDYPGTTLLGINRLLADKDYRRKVVNNLKDPVVKAFWQNEFASYNDRYAQEAVAPIQNKIGQFLSASVIRNMVAQVKSTINVREIMDSQKIFIMNLSKGRIGEDNSRLLGGMLITELQLAAMARVDTAERDRKDFFLYVDEFQNFATPSFANILSEARKYRLSLIMAHQYVAQLDEVVADAVFGNVGTMVTFRVGGADAEVLVKEFTPTFLEEDIVNLPKFQVLLKLMIDGVASQPFSAMTMPPIGSPTDSFEKVVRVSRERYAKNRLLIEDKIMRWSGMGDGDENDDDDDGGESNTMPPTPPAGDTPANPRPTPPVPKADRPRTDQPRAVSPAVPPREPRPRAPIDSRPPAPKIVKAPAKPPEGKPPEALSSGPTLSLTSLLPPSPKTEPVAPVKNDSSAPVPQQPATTSIPPSPVPAPVVPAAPQRVTIEPQSVPPPSSETSHGDSETLTRSQKKRRRRKKKMEEQRTGTQPLPPRASDPIPTIPAVRQTPLEQGTAAPLDTPAAPVPTTPKEDTPRPTSIGPDQVVRFDD